jgi:hypothetical protein
LSIFAATREFSSENIDKLMRTIMCITHPLATIDELEYWAWYGVRDQESAKEKKKNKCSHGMEGNALTFSCFGTFPLTSYVRRDMLRLTD